MHLHFLTFVFKNSFVSKIVENYITTIRQVQSIKIVHKPRLVVMQYQAVKVLITYIVLWLRVRQLHSSTALKSSDLLRCLMPRLLARGHSCGRLTL